MICQLSFGKANLSNTSATYACMKVDPPFHRVTAITSGKRVGYGQQTTQVGTHNMNGAIVTVNVEHPSGTVILLQTKWMRGPSLLREGSLFLRLRTGAPLYNIAAFVPTSHDNIMGDRFSMFQGNADIMTLDELKLLNIEVNRGYASRYMDLEELAECYQITRVSAETLPRPAISAVATPQGLEMREMAQPARRRLIVRDRGQK